MNSSFNIKVMNVSVRHEYFYFWYFKCISRIFNIFHFPCFCLSGRL